MDNIELEKEILVSEIIDLKEISFETLSYFNFIDRAFCKKDFKKNMKNFIIKFNKIKTLFYNNSDNIVKNDEYYDIDEKILLISKIINKFSDIPDFEYNYDVCLNLFLISDNMVNISLLLTYSSL